MNLITKSMIKKFEVRIDLPWLTSGGVVLQALY